MLSEENESHLHAQTFSSVISDEGSEASECYDTSEANADFCNAAPESSSNVKTNIKKRLHSDITAPQSSSNVKTNIKKRLHSDITAPESSSNVKRLHSDITTDHMDFEISSPESVEVYRSRQELTSSWDMEKKLVPTKSAGFVYKFCPSLTKKQQYQLEYSLPIVLPLWFSVSNLSQLAFYWTLLIVFGHSLQTYMTAFGCSDKKTRLINPMTHHMMDCVWLQTLITTMVIWPSLFAISKTRVCVISLLINMLIPIYLSVSYKSFYCINTKPEDRNSKKDSAIGQHIQNCFWWYVIATVLLFFGFNSTFFASLGLVTMNAAPFILTSTFMNTFTQVTCYDDSRVATERTTLLAEETDQDG